MKNLFRGLRRLAGQTVLASRRTIAGGYACAGLPKVLTAMIRVKNEEQFLEAAVKSIIDHVNRIVIIDNQSSDRTPVIVRDLELTYPDKIVGCSYDYAIFRVGKENSEAASVDAKDPRLLSNFYNFCLKQCRTRFVLKWDGDMIATESFGRALREFCASRSMVFSFRGANVHPNRESLIAPRRNGNDQWDVLDNWTDEYTDHEPRVFPRFLAKYDTGFSWCERLSTPYVDDSKWISTADSPLYAHLKYCKFEPYANMSSEFATDVQQQISEGKRLSDELVTCLARFMDVRRASANDSGAK